MLYPLSTPDPAELGSVVAALRSWQRDDAPVQLHPGDLGWAWRHGEGAVADSVRVWRSGDEIAAVGFVDGTTVLRMTVSPQRWTDHELAQQVVAAVSDPDRGVLPAGEASVEVPQGTAVQQALRSSGWDAGEAWTPLRRDLSAPIEVSDALQAEVVGPVEEPAFTEVHRSAWGTPSFTAEAWRTMVAGAPSADALCLLGRDRDRVPVAGVTVWSAGPGRPGLLEPMGVAADHRGRGYGRAICAAAAALRALGASSALVCTPSSLTSAVATYRSAGFVALPERLDCTRAR